MFLLILRKKYGTIFPLTLRYKVSVACIILSLPSLHIDFHFLLTLNPRFSMLKSRTSSYYKDVEMAILKNLTPYLKVKGKKDHTYNYHVISQIVPFFSEWLIKQIKTHPPRLPRSYNYLPIIKLSLERGNFSDGVRICKVFYAKIWPIN